MNLYVRFLLRPLLRRSASLRLRSRRRGAAATTSLSSSGRRRRRRGRTAADAISVLVLTFVVVVILGIIASWTYIFLNVVRSPPPGGWTGQLRAAAERRVKSKLRGARGRGGLDGGAAFHLMGVPVPDFGRAVGGVSSLGSSSETVESMAAKYSDNVPIEDAAVGRREMKRTYYDDDDPGLHPVQRLKLPGPVIVVGMPKSGTTSIHSYFKCGGRKSSHFACEAPPKEGEDNQKVPGEPWRNCRLPEGAGGPSSSKGDYPLCGVCVQRNILRGRPPLEGCGEYEVWSELDSAEHPLPTTLANIERKKKEKEEKAKEDADKKVQEQIAQLEQEGGEVTDEEVRELADVAQQELGKATSEAENTERADSPENDDDYGGVRPLCSYPQITHLDEIHTAYPNATFILNLRPVEKWIKSVSKWTGDRRKTGLGYLRQVLTRCDFPGLPPGKGGDDADLAAFYNDHSERIRDFVRQHPGHALVEVNIEEPEAGKVMEKAFGISSDCWTVRNASPGPGAAGERGRRRGRLGRREDIEDDVLERLRQRRRERERERGRGQGGRHEESERERRRNDRLDRDRAEDIREGMMEGVRRRREQRREELREERLEMKREGRRPGGGNDSRDRRREGRYMLMRRRRGGRSRLRFRKYPMCTDVDDLFQQPEVVSQRQE